MNYKLEINVEDVTQEQMEQILLAVIDKANKMHLMVAGGFTIDNEEVETNVKETIVRTEIG